jgi:hypothetical protein
MDALRPDPADNGWTPTDEKVLGPAQLSAPVAGSVAVDVPGPDDLEAFQDLTYEQLARARGLDAASDQRLGELRLPRPGRDRPEPAAVSMAAPAPSSAPAPAPGESAGRLVTEGRAPTAEIERPATDGALATWPPAGGLPVAPVRVPTKNLGPVPSKHRPGSSTRRGRGGAAVVLLVLVLVALAAWYFSLGPGRHHHSGGPAAAPTVPATRY